MAKKPDRGACHEHTGDLSLRSATASGRCSELPNLIGVLARLQTVPQELYEAAHVDGANALQRFFHVPLPQLKSVLFVIVLLRSIWMFTKFDTPWLMIQGGGAETYIRTLPVYTYMRTFSYYEAGLGSAMAVVMFLALAAVTAIYFRIWQREENL